MIDHLQQVPMAGTVYMAESYLHELQQGEGIARYGRRARHVKPVMKGKESYEGIGLTFPLMPLRKHR